MTQVDPNDFIITRKRKLYKFALFKNSPLCYEFDEWDHQQPVAVVEIGAGTGLFSVALAEAQPDTQFLAVDVKADRLQTGARLAAEKGLTNIRFLRSRADLLPRLLPVASLQSIWITFPDPFGRERSSARRLTHPNYLAQYRSLLATDGALFLKHDNPTFFNWSLEQLVAEKWVINQLSFDLHQSDLPDSYKIMTTYEQRWTNQGLVSHFVKVTPSSLY